MSPIEQDAQRRSGRGSCVVLTAPGVNLPHRLRAALKGRSLRIEHRDDAFQAMASLVRRDRPLEDDLLILILVEPVHLERADELTRLVPIYSPHAVIWSYVENGAPRLAAFVRSRGEQERAAQSPAIEIKSTARAFQSERRARHAAGTPRSHGSRPVLRLTGTEPDSFESPAAPSPDEPLVGEKEDGPLDPMALTDEELEMLLSDAWLDDNGGKGDEPSQHAGP